MKIKTILTGLLLLSPLFAVPIFAACTDLVKTTWKINYPGSPKFSTVVFTIQSAKHIDNDVYELQATSTPPNRVGKIRCLQSGEIGNYVHIYFGDIIVDYDVSSSPFRISKTQAAPNKVSVYFQPINPIINHKHKRSSMQGWILNQQ